MTKPNGTAARQTRPKRKLIPIKQAIYSTLAFGLLAASIYLFFVASSISRPFFERPFNIYRLIVMSSAVIFLILATSRSRNDKNVAPEGGGDALANKWLTRLCYIVPAVTILILILQLACPEFATLLVRKESWPFFRNAIFLKVAYQLFGLIFFAKLVRYYFKRGNYWGVILSLLVTITFFLMAGEELSWGQRIFGWSQPSIAAGNAQSETNFHNFATQSFQNILYLGGWLLLIALPFWRNSLAKLFSKIKQLNFLADWLPPLSFVFIFASSFCFGDPLMSETGLYYGSNLFIIIATAIILLVSCFNFIKARNRTYLHLAVANLIIYLGGLVVTLFFSRVWSFNAGAPTEYLETYISLGLMLWAITISRRIRLTNHQE